MKKLIYIILLLLIATPLFGQSTVIVAKKKAAACSVATNEVGTRGEGGSNTNPTADRLYCNLFTPDCSGKLYTPNLYHYSTGSANAKVCIYTDDGDSAPDSGDELVICSSAIASESSAGWKDGTLATNPSVSTETNYWVCFISDSTGWGYLYTSGLATKTLDSSYSSPPANLNGTWGNINDRRISMYVTIGD
jgi:hypothetical protein